MSTIAKILGGFSLPRIREVAFKRYANTNKQSIYLLRSLKTILHEGDARRVAELIRLTDSKHDLHQLGYQILDLCEAGHAAKLEDSLRQLYYRSGCGICRKFIVSHLIDIEALTELERRQLRWDSDAYTRRLYEGDGVRTSQTLHQTYA